MIEIGSMASPIFDPIDEDSHVSTHNNSSPAVLDGSAILRRYQKSRELSQSFTSISQSLFSTTASNQVFSSPGFFDAVADGSKLALQYSAKKRHSLDGIDGNIDSPIFYNDTNAIDMIKNALIQLTNFQLIYSEQIETTELIDNHIPSIIRTLRRVEDKLETADISKDFPSPLEKENEHYIIETPTKVSKTVNSVDSDYYAKENQILIEEVNTYSHLLQNTTDEFEHLKVKFTLLSENNYDHDHLNVKLEEAYAEINILRSQVSRLQNISYENEKLNLDKSELEITMNDLKELLKVKSDDLRQVYDLLDNYKHVDDDQKRQIETLQSQLVSVKQSLEADTLHTKIDEYNLFRKDFNDSKEYIDRLEHQSKSMILGIDDHKTTFENFRCEATESKLQYELEIDDLKNKFYSSAQQCDTLCLDLQNERIRNNSLEVANSKLSKKILFLSENRHQSSSSYVPHEDATSNIYDDVIDKLMDEKAQMAIRESQLIADMSDLENMNKEYLTLLAAKDEEIALAEDVLKDIQTQFEEAKAHMHLKLEQARVERSRIGEPHRLERTTTTPYVDNSARKGVENNIFDESMYDNVMFKTVSMREMHSVVDVDMTSDLSRTINQQEYQIKVQVSQLQALQDSVAEYRSSNAILKQHKKGLRDLSETYKKKLEMLENDLVNINAQIQNYVSLLDQEVLNHQKTKDVLFSIQEEFSRTKDDLLRQKEYVQVSNNQPEIDELKIECSKLKNRLDIKTQRLDETRTQVKQLREELNLRGNGYAAAFKEKQADCLNNEVTRQHYEDFINLLEYKNNDLLVQLDEKDRLLKEIEAGYQFEKEVGMNLRDLLNKLGEKDTTTEDLLHVVKAKREELTYELNEAIEIIKEKSMDLGACDEEITILKDREVELRKQLLDSEKRRTVNEIDLLSIKTHMSTIEDSSKVQLEVLNHHLDEIILSKTQAEETVQIQIQTINQLCSELDGKNYHESKVQNEIKKIVGIVTKFHASMKDAENTQIYSILQKLDRLESRVQNASNNIIFAKRCGRSESSVQALEESISETKYALSSALTNVTELVVEKNILVAKLNETQREHDYLERSYIDSQNWQELYEKSQEDVFHLSEESKFLREQLKISDQSLVELSAKNANDFARSTKSIAYLESECERMQQLIDHFKSVNINLTDDLKKSQDLIEESTSLGQHLISLQQSEESLIETVKNMDAEVKSKELDYLVLQGKMHEEQLLVVREHEVDICLREKNYKLLESKYFNLSQDFDAYKDQVLISRELQNQEVVILQNSNRNLISEKSTFTNMLDECHLKYKSLKNVFDEKVYEINSLEQRIKVENEKFSVSLEAYVRKIHLLESHVGQFSEESKKSEIEMNKIKNELNEVREELVYKDEIIASNLEKHALLKDEMRQCRVQSDSFQDKSLHLATLNTSLKSNIYDMQLKCDQLEKQYSDFKNNTYRTVSLEAAIVEDNLKQCSNELNSVKYAFAKSQDDLFIANNSLRLSENKVEELQSVIFRIQAKDYMVSNELESSRDHVSSLTNQITSLKSSHDSSISELAQKTFELDNLSRKTIDIENTLQNYVSDISAMRDENQRLTIENTVHITNSNEAVVNMRSILRKLGIVLKDVNLKIALLGSKTINKADVFHTLSSILPDDEFSVTLKSTISSLGSGIQNIENLFHVFYKLIEEMSQGNSNMTSIINSLKNGLLDLENSRISEKKLHDEKLSAMEKDLFLRSKEFTDLKASYQALWNQLSSEKVESSEVKAKYNSLEDEIALLSQQNEELKLHVGKWNITCGSLNKTIQELEEVRAQQEEAFQHLSDDYGLVCNRSTDRELEMERTLSLFDRLKAEKDAADHVRHGLEVELERIRIEMNTFRLNYKTDNSRFELEKLLVTLSSSFEQFPCLNPRDSIKLLSSDDLQEGIADKMAPSRVDYAIKYIGDVRNWTRTEIQSRKSAEDRVDKMSAELSNLNSIIEKNCKQLSQTSKENSEKEIALRRTASDNMLLQEKLNKAEDEVQQLQDKYTSITKSISEEKVVSNNIHQNLLRCQSDLSKIENEKEDYKTQISKLSEQLLASNEKQNMLLLECDRRDGLLRQSKANNARLSSTIEHLEKGLEADKQDRDNLDKRLISAEVTINSASRLKSQISDLEDALKQTRIDYQRELDSKINAEIESQKSKREAEGECRKSKNLESLLDCSQKEKNILFQTLSDLKQKHTTLKEQYDNEHMLRLKSDAELYYVRKPDQISRNDDRHTDENHNWKQALEDKEKERLMEYNARMKLEQDMQKLKAILERANHELKVSSERSSSLRLAGRKSKGKIDDAVGRIRELVNIIRSDAKSNGISISISNGKSKYMFSAEYSKNNVGLKDTEVNSSEFLDALGLLELHDSLNALRDVVVWLREFPRDRFHFEVIKSNLEAEKEKLSKDLEVSTKTYTEKLTKLQIEVDKAKFEGGDVQVLLDISKKEKSEKEAAHAEIQNMKGTLDRLNKEIHHSQNNFMQNHSVDDESEVFKLRAELLKVSHQRDILKETVDKIENKVLSNVDTSFLKSEFHRFNGEENYSTQDVARLQCKLSAMEELVSTYRSSVLSLCSDGEMKNTFGNCKTPDLKVYANQQSKNRTWIEREIAIIKRSYDNEIHLLESEVKDLRSKLQQSLTFMSELRLRFEENLKSLYKSSKDSNSEILMKEIERLNLSLETSEKSTLKLYDQLSLEHQNSRTRHHKLIECLVKTLQSKDAAIAAVHRIEDYCMQTGLDHVKEFSQLQIELENIHKHSGKISNENAEQKSTIDVLLRRLIEIDHDIVETERKSNISNISVMNNSIHNSFDYDEKLLTRLKDSKSKTYRSSPIKNSGRDSKNYYSTETIASKPFIVKHLSPEF